MPTEIHPSHKIKQTKSTLFCLLIISALTTSAWAEPTLVGDIFPAGRSIQVGDLATAFATITNTGEETAVGCSIQPLTPIPDTNFLFAPVDPLTSTLSGPANTPIDIRGNSTQKFNITFVPNLAFSPIDVPFSVGCANTDSEQTTPGLNTLLLSASLTPVTDIVALTTLPGRQLTLTTPTATEVFLLASLNLGTSDLIRMSADTGTTSLPVNLLVCEFDASLGTCMAPPNQSVSRTINTGEITFYAVFVVGQGRPIPLNPANSRIFVRFFDQTDTIRGITSVAVKTNSHTPNFENGQTGFTSYNDLAWTAGQLASNITTFTSSNGNSGLSSAGQLVDFTTGQPTSVTLTVDGGSFNGFQADQGSDPGEGTDAHALFNGIVSAQGTVSYISQPNNSLVLTLTGLDPNKIYDLAYFSHRNEYGWERASLVTISGQESFTNISSEATDNPSEPGGVLFTGPSDPSTRLPADNRKGYIAQFANINPGSNGQVVLTISFDGSIGTKFKGKYGNALRLQETTNGNDGANSSGGNPAPPPDDNPAPPPDDNPAPPPDDNPAPPPDDNPAPPPNDSPAPPPNDSPAPPPDDNPAPPPDDNPAPPPNDSPAPPPDDNPAPPPDDNPAPPPDDNPAPPPDDNPAPPPDDNPAPPPDDNPQNPSDQNALFSCNFEANGQNCLIGKADNEIKSFGNFGIPSLPGGGQYAITAKNVKKIDSSNLEWYFRSNGTQNLYGRLYVYFPLNWHAGGNFANGLKFWGASSHSNTNVCGECVWTNVWWKLAEQDGNLWIAPQHSREPTLSTGGRASKPLTRGTWHYVEFHLANNPNGLDVLETWIDADARNSPPTHHLSMELFPAKHDKFGTVAMNPNWSAFTPSWVQQYYVDGLKTSARPIGDEYGLLN